MSLWYLSQDLSLPLSEMENPLQISTAQNTGLPPPAPRGLSSQERQDVSISHSASSYCC